MIILWEKKFYVGKDWLQRDVYGDLFGRRITGRNYVETERKGDKCTVISIKDAKIKRLEGSKREKFVKKVWDVAFYDDTQPPR